MAPAIIIAAIATAIYGRVYDSKGYKFSIVFPLIMLAIGYILLILFRNIALVFIGSMFMMSGYLCGMSIFGAKIRDLIPENKAGQFQRIISQVFIPGIIGPFVGSSVLKNAEMILNSDGTYSFLPNNSIFIAALIVIIILAIFLIVLNNKDKYITISEIEKNLSSYLKRNNVNNETIKKIINDIKKEAPMFNVEYYMSEEIKDIIIDSKEYKEYLCTLEFSYLNLNIKPYCFYTYYLKEDLKDLSIVSYNNAYKLYKIV